MARKYSSIAEAKTLTADVASNATQITLSNVTGLPSRPYVLVLNPDTANEEAVLVTSDQAGVTSPTLKVTRAIETGATAKTHSVGHVVKHMIVGSDLEILHDHFSNDNITTGTAHGATGGVVGRTNSQTLTNKTITLGDNTVTGTKAQFNAAITDADFVTIAGTETLTAKTLTSPVITGGTVNGGVALTVDSTELNILDGAILSTTELNYVDGVTSNIQTQLDAKAPLANPTFTGTVTLPTGTVTTGMILDGTIVNADINASAAIVASKLTGTTAEFNGALSDNDFATLAGTETLSNKTLTYPTINSSSTNNTKIGSSALVARTTGVNNTAVGMSALISMTSGEENTAVGNNTLNSITASVGNVAVGSYALTNATSGQLNTAVGSNSAPSITTGSNNTILGYNGAISLTTGSNNTVIGYNANTSTGTVSNQVVLGNSSITDLRCQDTTISAPSDIRDKTDVQPIPVGLDFINDIRPVNFEWNMRDGGQVGNRQGGFIAQEVLAVEQQYNTRNWLGMVNDENPDQLVLAPAKLIPIMVKALQELSEQVEELKAKVAELEVN